MKNKPTFEIKRLLASYEIVKVFPPEKMFSISPPYTKVEPAPDHQTEETVCEINLSKDSEQYCNIICQALNKKFK